MGERSSTGIWRSAALFAACVLAMAALVACGDDDDDDGGDVAAADLTALLPAAEDLLPDLETEREFEWDNPIDYVAEGVLTSEGTSPSTLVDPIDEEDFEAGAGQQLTDDKREKFTVVSVAAFESEEGAEAARDLLHEEDLKQPCFAACVVSGFEHEVEGIPDAAAVHQKPNEGKPPPGLFPFEGFHIEFPIGSNLFALYISGPPGSVTADQFDAAATAFYEHAQAQS